MSTSPSPPARTRTRSQARDGQYSSNDDSDDHGTPPANQQQASADRLHAVTSDSDPESPSSPAERRIPPKRRSKKALYPSEADLARWPHFVSERRQGQRAARDDLSPGLDASLYSEVQRIARQIIYDRTRATPRQAANPSTSATDINTNQNPDKEPGQPTASSVASSSSSASSPVPSSHISSRSASSIEFSEDEETPRQVSHRSTLEESDSNSQASWSPETDEGGGGNLLPDSLLDPLVLGVQARLDALLWSLAMEHSVKQKRAISKKEKKRPMGHEEVLDLLQRDLERGSLGMVELQQRKSVLNKARKRVTRGLGLERADEGAREDAVPELDAATATSSASAHGLRSGATLQGRESAAHRDAALLLEPFGLFRSGAKRKRKAKNKKKPLEELPALEEAVETELPRKAQKQREQVIRGGGGFLLCRPPISSTAQ
ncbi:hypothetical protein BCV69DRAFT_283284 [Microstroma glucosiphilum]|uniref:Something about silencing protein 4 domain-containing protein n=1 Tax=Pseudomicrostroma glucosiphilum TaxID=1684307 RepID=A0A316U7S0_9BASI|nr:hypothetical protein BCV69DRAFT_283284 [Pseudomicrostroma glucosiphilum]PWN20403.1 hypothetical protein BCV69DRAFT_283284 [Pseudomicrostroma glucosiphilum]